MHNWFECKVSYEKMLENGMQKKVTEPYLVDALSFTEAEARIIEEIRPFITGEFTVTDIKRARLSELFFNENGDRFYKIKVYFITLDEKSGAEKKTAAGVAAAKTVMSVGTYTNGTIPDIAVVGQGTPQLVQLCVRKDDAFNRRICDEAEKTAPKRPALPLMPPLTAM